MALPFNFRGVGVLWKRSSIASLSHKKEMFMPAHEFWKKWKTHLVFGGGFIIVFIINVVLNFGSGQTFWRSMIAALSDIKPMEYAMFVLFWYAMASKQNFDSRPTFTTLNLRDSKS